MKALLNFRFWVQLFFFGYIYSFFIRKVQFITADLGRHIKNGLLVRDSFDLLFTNFYSYTMPDFMFINHHWGAGFLFSFLWEWGGFVWLGAVYSTILITSFWLFFRIAVSFSNLWLAMSVSLLLLPLLTARPEIRPEGLSYFYLAILIFLLVKVFNQAWTTRCLMCLPFLFVIWVNSHIMFCYGLLCLFGFLFLDAIKPAFGLRSVLSWRGSLIVFATSFLACFINPSSWQGVLVPLRIFVDYGYNVLENQSLFFLHARFLDPIYLYIECILMVVFLVFVFGLMKYKFQFNFLIFGFLSLFFGLLTVNVFRNLVLFGYFTLPGLALMLHLLFKKIHNTRFFRQGVAFMVMFLLGVVGLNWSLYNPISAQFGWGLISGSNHAAHFFKLIGLRGPIFNNYDIGGYLIYHLFPQEKVYVDNRPEAYPSRFLQEDYLLLQEFEDKWQVFDRRVGFNCLFFYRHDLTEYAQPFLIRRIEDPTWIPIYVDDYVIILIKDSLRNKAIIERYQLPQSMFMKVKRS